MWRRTAVEFQFKFYQSLKIEEKCVNYKKKISWCDSKIRVIAFIFQILSGNSDTWAKRLPHGCVYYHISGIKIRNIILFISLYMLIALFLKKENKLMFQRKVY